MSLTIGLIHEGKIPADNRVALTPEQCKWIKTNYPGIRILVQTSPTRSFKDAEYKRAGLEIVEDMSPCDILFGIKEVPVEVIIPNKTYLFFSHTRKKQPYNQKLLQTILEKGCTLIDYECMEHEDGQRIIGFGFFAGIVGAHNGIMTYGERTGAYKLPRVYEQKDFKHLINAYFGLKLPNLKIVVTGSGRVAHGMLEVMNLMGIIEVEKEDFLNREFAYPVYVQVKGADLYEHKGGQTYNREHFHSNPLEYRSRFEEFLPHTDILMNGVFWDNDVPRLFRISCVSESNFRISVIADVTDDTNGSVPINLGDQSIENPVYGVDRKTFQKTAPFLPTSVDVMAVGNLPNELPRDASKYFGEQLIKFILPPLFGEGSPIIDRATIVKNGKLTPRYEYLSDFASGPGAGSRESGV